MAKRPYDTLLDDLRARIKDEGRRETVAHTVAGNFRSAFASFLGVDGSDSDERLVFLWGLRRDNGEVVAIHKGEEATTEDWVLRDMSHNWIFAIHIRLAHLDFVCRCSIRFVGERIEIRVGDRQDAFTVTPDDMNGYQPAVEALFEHFRKWLQWRPSSGQPEPEIVMPDVPTTVH